ncbi:hypothetical protein LCGC14_1373030, partial [marine sediment metagenome]
DIDKFIQKLDIKRNIAIIARTESLVRGYGEWETFLRLQKYDEAGADYVFPHSRTKPLDLPVNTSNRVKKMQYVIAPTKFPEYTTKQLYSMGYDMIIHANQTERVKIKAVRDMLSDLKKYDRMLEAEKHLCATLDDMKGLTPNE